MWDICTENSWKLDALKSTTLRKMHDFLNSICTILQLNINNSAIKFDISTAVLSLYSSLLQILCSHLCRSVTGNHTAILLVCRFRAGIISHFVAKSNINLSSRQWIGDARQSQVYHVIKSDNCALPPPPSAKKRNNGAEFACEVSAVG